MREIVYLACPYTDSKVHVREERFRAATEAAAALIRQGRIVFSPITMTHPIDVVLSEGEGTLGSDFWVSFDEAFMSCCSEMIILQVPGWNTSRGIAREVEFFRSQRKPISIMSADHQLMPASPTALELLPIAS